MRCIDGGMTGYRISHRTTYTYTRPVTRSHHLLHLSPCAVAHQKIHNHNLLIEPAPQARTARADYFGNPVEHLVLEDEHTKFTVTAQSHISVHERERVDVEATSPWEDVARGRLPNGGVMARDLHDFTCHSRHAAPTQASLRFARKFFSPGVPVLEGTRQLMAGIHEAFEFDPTTTDIATPVDRVLELRSGVCQDFAHVQISALRALGIPARYVSGYIRTEPPEGQPRLAGADASHAWVSIWAPETGWVDFDPTNNLMNSTDHITIAFGRDYDDISPISGVLLGGGDHGVSVAVDVIPS